MNKYLLAIPFYKNEKFIDEIIRWFKSTAAQIDRELISEVVVINDCPSSEGSEFLQSKCAEIGFLYVKNQENIGYLRTANAAYEKAKLKDVCLILLNSDTIPFPGFLSEINKCFERDSMLGIVSARSNNATICNIYDRSIYYEDERSLQKFQKDSVLFQKYLPDISYVPVVTGFCFAIHRNVIKTFDGFDAIYTVGYEEENDFCIRVSERGYRIGIANKAFVAHLEGKSFELTGVRKTLKEKNAEIIRNKYLFYDNIIENYSNSLTYSLEKRVAKVLDNQKKILIDARVLSPYFNGSNKLIVEYINALVKLDYLVDISVNISAAKFHNLTDSPNINFIQEPSKIYEIGILLGQPMYEPMLWTIPRHSLVSLCIFFDTIAHDCPQLRAENKILDSLWTILPFVYTDISFISEHSHEQFKNKFGTGLAKLHTHLLPINVKSFSSISNTMSSNCALVFGNKFIHKGIDILLSQLPEVSDFKYYILGHATKTTRSDIIFLNPGEISKDHLDELFKKISFSIMPSFAEGFGFPLIETLSYGKPIYCRDIKCYREIIEVIPEEYQSLVRIVEDFFDLNKYKTKKDISYHSVRFDSYEDYVKKIMSDIEVVSSELFFNSLKARYLFIREEKYTKYSFRNVIRNIYSLLLATSFAPYIRYIKKQLFKFKIVSKMLVGEKI